MNLDRGVVEIGWAKRVGTALVAFGPMLFVLTSCSTLPETSHKEYKFPKEDAFMEQPPEARQFIRKGEVKSKVNFSTIGIEDDNGTLCRNYFNRAVQKLLEYAKGKQADAVIEIRSVVILIDGKVEAYPRPECYEDGTEGQILARGTAIKWLPNRPEAEFNKPGVHKSDANKTGVLSSSP